MPDHRSAPPSPRRRLRFLAAAGLALLLGAGCADRTPAYWQGYLEGEYIYVGAPLAGRLETLAVAKGARLEAGAPLFALERAAELAAQRESAQRLAQAQARLADLRKGQRPTELEALAARLAQARSSAELADAELARIRRLHEGRIVADEEFDRARLSADRARQQVAELAAQLATASLGARSDLIAAAAAEVAAAEAALARADWAVAQKQVAAPVAGLVFDTIFRPGEFVPAAQPVVSLLPAANLKVRFYVPEPEVARVRLGQTVQVAIAGRDGPLPARVSFVSPQAEFTPPVIYSRETRSKLVFRVEAVFDPAAAATLHVGQPVEVAPPS